MNKLEGKTAVVTGGSSGIGLATAQRFVSEGAHVYIKSVRMSQVFKVTYQILQILTGYMIQSKNKKVGLIFYSQMPA
jgi:NADP-dependent 3-hydroxy acid dehydrogenase YdfG